MNSADSLAEPHLVSVSAAIAIRPAFLTTAMVVIAAAQDRMRRRLAAMRMRSALSRMKPAASSWS